MLFQHCTSFSTGVDTYDFTLGLQARQRAELNATDADSKLKALIWTNDHSTSSDKKHSQAVADMDASLMQRLEQDSSNNQRLSEALQAAQVGSQPNLLTLCVPSNTC